MFDLFFKNGNLYDEQFTKPKTMNNEVFHVFCGVTSEDKEILKRFYRPNGFAITFRVTGTSLQALPSDEEMHKISCANSCIVFPGGVKWSLSGPQKRVELLEFMRRKMASIVYVDKEAELFWAANKIDMRGEKYVKIEVAGTELVNTTYFLSELEVVGSDF